MTKPKIGILTSGGIAPCLSASIGRLIKKYTAKVPNAEIIGYLNGYKGLLLGNKIEITPKIRENAHLLYEFGGSVIGNSRVKISNTDDCVKKGYIQKGENPLEIAANQLKHDGITILHTIGGDDTNTSAATLSQFLKENNYDLTVVGLPKTVDNDVFPIKQTLGAWTAAEQGAKFFENVANENTTSTRQLIIHEVMGRNCGWLTSATAYEYRSRLQKKEFLPEILLSKNRWDIDAIYIPEMDMDFDNEIDRLKRRMDKKDSINIFLSEGAGINTIIAEMEKNGEKLKRDAFGHVRLDEINPGQWFAGKFESSLKADKVLVQKSGYFARSAAPIQKDLDLIFKTVDLSIKSALNGKSGVVGMDLDHDDELRCIEFDRIKGGKPFDINTKWFNNMLKDIGQK